MASIQDAKESFGKLPWSGDNDGNDIQNLQFLDYANAKGVSDRVFAEYRRQYSTGELNEMPKPMLVLQKCILDFIDELEDRILRPKSGFTVSLTRIGKTRSKRTNVRNNVINKCFKVPERGGSFLENMYTIIKRSADNLHRLEHPSFVKLSFESYKILEAFENIRKYYKEDEHCVGYDGVRNFIKQVKTNGHQMMYPRSDPIYSFSQLLGIAESANKIFVEQLPSLGEEMAAKIKHEIDYIYALETVKNLDFVRTLERAVILTGNRGLLEQAIKILMRRFGKDNEDVKRLLRLRDDPIPEKGEGHGSRGGGRRKTRRRTSRKAKTLRRR